MAFVFRRTPSGWIREADLYIPQYNPEFDMSLGASVGISGGTIAVGAPSFISAWMPGPSSVWIYEYDEQLEEWQPTQNWRASDEDLAQGMDLFGTSLALHGDNLVVSAPYGWAVGPKSGTAYRYERTNGEWNEVERLVSSDPSTQVGLSSYFGSGVALDGINGRVLIGASGADIAGQSGHPGKGYMFDINRGTIVCASPPNLTFKSTRFTVTGSKQASDANVALTVYDAPPGFGGIFLIGPGGTPFPLGEAGGSLCVGSPFARLTGFTTIGEEGSAMHQVDFGVDAAANMIQPGTRLTFQFIHRDVYVLNDLPTLNMSEAIEVLFE
jgi:hypothetical protein